jgi:hypothetical protein
MSMPLLSIFDSADGVDINPNRYGLQTIHHVGRAEHCGLFQIGNDSNQSGLVLAPLNREVARRLCLRVLEQCLSSA